MVILKGNVYGKIDSIPENMQSVENGHSSVVVEIGSFFLSVVQFDKSDSSSLNYQRIG